MPLTPRQKFLDYVRASQPIDFIISPFLPNTEVINNTLRKLKQPVSDDFIKNEIQLSKILNYQPMFMTDLSGLIFNWQVDEARSDETTEVSVIHTRKGEWLRRFPRGEVQWNDAMPCPVQTEADHEYLVLVCEQVGNLEANIRHYFRDFRQRVGENGVIVAGHPHPSWLGYQISPAAIYYQWSDFPDTFRRSMDAVYEASLFVMSIAMAEGIDFMSDSSYGLEMTSPQLFEEMDLPYIQAFSKWTHDRNGLFWYHNCGFTRKLIMDGTFNKLGADVIETIAAPPEGDNDLAESRKYVAPSICTKGNFKLTLLREGTPDEIAAATRNMIHAVQGYKHIISTADAVLPGTPVENFLAFIETAKDVCA